MQESLKPSKYRNQYWTRPILLLGMFICLMLIVVNMYVIPISWDEGWNFCVAKNWVQNNHFGCQHSGKFTTARLATGLLSIAPSALGFKLFGIDYIQGRMFIALQCVVFIVASVYLTRRIFGKSEAALLPFIFCLGSADTRVNPLFIGAQGWGEMPLLSYLMLGYLTLTVSTDSRAFELARNVCAGLLFGLALFAKIQGRPFILFGLVAASLWCLYSGNRKSALTGLFVSIFSYVTLKVLVEIPLPMQAELNHDGAGTQGLPQLLGIVLEPGVRWKVLQIVVFDYFLFVLGLGWFAFCFLTRSSVIQDEQKGPLIPVAILLTSVSWLAWFLLLSIQFPRYVAVPVGLAAPFVAYFLCEMWRRFGGEFISRSGALDFSKSESIRAMIRSVSLCYLLIIALSSAIFIGNHTVRFWNENRIIHETARYLNEHFGSNDLIETYDTELFFLLNVPFRYPPDQFHMNSISSYVGGKDLISYDPLAANPTVIVEGPWSREVFKVYSNLIESRALKPVQKIGSFEIYLNPERKL